MKGKRPEAVVTILFPQFEDVYRPAEGYRKAPWKYPQLSLEVVGGLIAIEYRFVLLMLPDAQDGMPEFGNLRLGEDRLGKGGPKNHAQDHYWPESLHHVNVKDHSA